VSHGSLTKDFIIPPGPWSDDHAETIEAFFQAIVTAHVSMLHGQYRGTGRVQTIVVRDLPRPPMLLVIQPSLGSTAYLTLLAYPSGNVSSWTNKGFTLSVAAAVNTQNVLYSYLILA